MKHLLITGITLLWIACSSATEQPDRKQEVKDTAQENPAVVQTATADTLVLSKEELLGKISPATHPGFVRIDRQYTEKPAIYLRREAYEAFERMAAAAGEAGLSLQIISATRNFTDQKNIWEAKWNGQRRVDGKDLSQSLPAPGQRALKILEYSSMPGSSRHHWGTDIDLNNLNNAYFATGEGKKLYDWLQAHAPAYGFCQVYTEKGENRPYGYNEEKWHWSYMPLSGRFLEQYAQKISYEDIRGFQGAEAAPEIEVISRYVQGIAPACKDWHP